MNFEQVEYDKAGDVLDVYFTEAQFKRRPVWTIELTPNIVIGIDRTARQAVQPTLMDYLIPHIPRLSSAGR